MRKHNPITCKCVCCKSKRGEYSEGYKDAKKVKFNNKKELKNV